MFDKYDVRLKIVLIWVGVFIALWIVLHQVLPLRSSLEQLNKIQESIENQNWTQAIDDTNDFINSYKKNKFIIRINNATEALTTYEHTIGQLEVTVKNKQESALEHIGALKEAANFVIKPFSGP